MTPPLPGPRLLSTPPASPEQPAFAIRTLAVFSAYSVLAAILTWPLLASMGTRVAPDLGDPVLNIWLMWWNAAQLPFTEGWWNGPFFHPVPGALAFSEHVVGLGLITTPILWLGGSPVLAYNAAFLLSFPLSGVAAYLLGRELTRSDAAAFVAGLIFAFTPYRIAQLSHVDILSWYWMPLALLGLHRYLRTSSPWALALFAVAWLMQVLCKGYAFFYFSTLVALWILWFAPPWRERSKVARLTGAWVVAVLPLLPVPLHYRAVHGQYRLGRAPFEIESFSADAAAPLYGSPRLAHWPWSGEGSETLLFPGVALVAILVVGLWRVLRDAPPVTPGRSRIRLGIAALAVVAAAIAVSAVVLGPWRVTLGPLKLSVKAVDKPLALAWTFAIVAAVLHPQFIGARRRRSALAFYASAAILCGLFSLGPSPTRLRHLDLEQGALLVAAAAARLLVTTGAGPLLDGGVTLPGRDRRPGARASDAAHAARPVGDRGGRRARRDVGRVDRRAPAAPAPHALRGSRTAGRSGTRARPAGGR